MRKKFLNGKRVLALALALSMVVSEAAFAQPSEGVVSEEVISEEAVSEEAVSEEANEAQETITDEAQDENLATETVSANDAQETYEDVTDGEDEQEAEESDEVEEEEDEDEDEDEDLMIEEALNGTPSQVIGVQVSPSYNTFTDENGNVVGRYTYTNDKSFPYLYVKGKVAEDPATGLYPSGGKYYTAVSYYGGRNCTSLNPSNEVVILPGTSKDAYKDAATGLYKVNGALYNNILSDYVNGKTILYYKVNEPKLIVVAKTNTATTLDMMKKSYGKYMNKQNTNPDYYEFGGVKYKGTPNSKTVSGQKIWYMKDNQIISLTREKARITWNTLSVVNPHASIYDTKSKVAYQVKVNGVEIHDGSTQGMYDAKGNLYYVTSNASFETKETFDPGQTVKVSVRGLYTHSQNTTYKDAAGEMRGETYDVVDAVGPWSEEVAIKIPVKTAVPKVSGLTAKVLPGSTNSNKQMVIRWNEIKEAYCYYVSMISTKKPAAITAANFGTVLDNAYSASVLTPLGLSVGDVTTNSSNYASIPEYSFYSWNEEYPYHYIAVYPSGTSDDNKYYNDVADESKVAMVASVTTQATPQLSTPAISNFRVEKQSDGTFDLVWNRINGNYAMVIYAYDSASFPALYQYKKWDYYVKRELPKKNQTGTPNTRSLSADRSTGSFYDPMLEQYLSRATEDYDYQKVKTIEVSSSERAAGRKQNILSSAGLTAGKKYYFVAYTFDTTDYQTVKKAPISYNFTARYSENGILKTKPITAQYVYYPALSAASAMVSVKGKLTKPNVSTYSTKNSVKLTMSGKNGLVTGYEIYRKSGKKYKKLITTTSNEYVDSKLKTGATYSYKVRSYSYDTDAKKTVYSEYTIVTAKTYPAAKLVVKSTKASKTSVKLSWSKVNGATKYEIYRTDTRNVDENLLSKKFSSDGSRVKFDATGYKLLKSTKKTSYIDKKLTAEENYTYLVIAYYKEGKSQQIQYGFASELMALDSPSQIQAVNKGNKVVITWKGDKYAAGYEVAYYRCDRYNNKTTLDPIITKTKKPTLTISGLETGAYIADICVRAYNSKKEYSDWSYPWFDGYNSLYGVDGKSIPLGAVKGIKAKEVTAKNGKTGVKITWKKVAGAKYYKVYRSTKMPAYDADTKLYDLEGYSMELIAKSGNDNYRKKFELSSLDVGGRYNSEEYYKEYGGVSGSIVGNSAYDYADLPAGVTYYYTVKAYGDKNGYTSSIQCSKPAEVLVKTGLGFSAKSKKGKVTLKWTAMKGASVKYTIYRGSKAKGKFTKLGTSKKPTFTDKKSKKGKTYYYKIQVTGKNGYKADIDVTSSAKKVKAK